MPLIARSDVEDALDPDDFVKLFDRNHDGAIGGTDLDWLEGRIAAAESTVLMRTRAAFPQGLAAPDGSVDQAVKNHAVAIACHLAVRLSPMATGRAEQPYRQAYLDALDFFDRLSADNRNRPVEGTTAAAEPVARADNLRTTDGIATSPYRRVADGQDESVY